MRKRISLSLKGFTLIELLVVIAIIIVLLAIGVTSYQNAQKVARDGKRKADLHQIQSALEMYRADNNSYPTAIGGLNGKISGTLTTPLVDDYIASLPTDPSDATDTVYFYYYSTADGASYNLCANLENDSDPERTSNPCGAGVLCGASAPCDYGIKNP